MSETITPENAALALSLNMDPETGLALGDDTRARLQAIVDNAQPSGHYEHVQVQDGIPPARQSTDSQGEVDIAAALASLQQQVTNLSQGAAPQQQLTIEDVLSQIDPRDSETALAMFQWLIDNGRLSQIGTLSGGGYLLHYSEPKGTSKAGYTPGATQGGRMVDAAVQKAKDSGATKRQQSMCPKCFSVVTKDANDVVVLDGDNPDPTCPGGGSHTWGE